MAELETEIVEKPPISDENRAKLRDILVNWKKNFGAVKEEFNLSQEELDEFMAEEDLFKLRLQNTAPMLNKMIETAMSEGDVATAKELTRIATDLYPPDDLESMKPIHVIFYKESVEPDPETKPKNATNQDPAPQIN